MRVFALSTGRVGSTSFARACSHIEGYSAAHESRAALLGDDRFAYPDRHIEVDHRLAWFLGDLARRFDDQETLYVHQFRDRDEVVDSWLARWDSLFRPTMVRAFGHGILMRKQDWSDADRRRVVEFYVDSVNNNIAEFVKARQHVTFRVEQAEEDFTAFVETLGARCDFDASLAEFAARHNPSNPLTPQRLRIRHVLPVVGASAPQTLRSAQSVTLEAIQRAAVYSRDRVDVAVVGARFPDERLPASWLIDAPTLTASSGDFGRFRVQRRLPLLRQVLDGLRCDDPGDYLVYTNVDIAPQPYFYELIDELCRDGYDFFTINRRDVTPPFDPSSRVLTQAKLGFGHPGHDCLVFKSSLLDEIDVGDVLLGVKWVARTLLWQLELLTANARHLSDLHATFHVGYDQVWTDPMLADYQRFNAEQAMACVERWTDRFGSDAVERLNGLTALQREMASVPRSQAVTMTARHTRKLDVRPRQSRGHRMIFCASSGRSGTAYLAELLGTAPITDSGHERAPQMVGGWLRDVMWKGLTETYRHRLAKVDAIQTTVSQLALNSIYVDTSHMFIKTFADVIFDRFPHDLLSVVVLRRDPIEVATSFHDLAYFSSTQTAWIDWMASPTAPMSMVGMPLNRVTSEFDLIFGYLAEVELRTAYFRERAPEVNWVDTNLADITSRERVASIFGALNIPVPDTLENVVSQRVNTRLRAKSERRQPISRGLVQQYFADYLERFSDLPGTDLLATRDSSLTGVAR